MTEAHPLWVTHVLTLQRSMVAIAVLIVSAIAWQSTGLAQSTPFVPDDWQYGRHADKGTLRYCIDPRDPEWELAEAIGEAISNALLLQPKPNVIADTIVTASLDDLYPHLLRDCDIYFGFKLIPGGYPGWLTLSRPYYEASYVLAVEDPSWASLADIPRDKPVGATIGTTADFAFIAYLKAAPPDKRWPRFPFGTNEATLQALHSGTVSAALVWGPSAWALQQSDSAYADLRFVPPSPLPVSTLGVGVAMLANDTFLRASIDQAIESLSADGTIETILTKHHFLGKVTK